MTKPKKKDKPNERIEKLKYEVTQEIGIQTKRENTQNRKKTKN